MAKELIRILVIEDDEDDYLLIRRHLRKIPGQEFDLTWCGTAREGDAALAEGRFDIATVDYRLGDTSGIDIVQDARAAGVRTPLILLTGQDELAIDLEAMAAGVDDYLSKQDLSPRLLGRSIRYAISRYRSETAQRELAEEKQRYADTLQAIMDHAPFGLWLTDGEGTPKFVNDTLCELVGVDPSAPEDLGDLGERFNAPVRDEFRRTTGRGASGKKHRTAYTTVRVPRKGTRDFKVTRVDIDDSGATMSGMIGIVEDVTETRNLQRKISYQATHDSLTQLINRQAFEEKLDQVCRTMASGDSSHALCYIDLDQFKVVNDTCGHAAGDALLRQLTDRFRRQLRKTESVADGRELEPALARIGGDEFGLLLYNCDADGARYVAERLVEEARAFCFSYGGRRFRVGCSIGVVVLTGTNAGATEAMRQADSACFMAKDKGRGRVYAYEPDDEDMRTHQGAMEWVPVITEAIAQDHLTLYAQPIVPCNDVEDGDRFEFLVRCQLPDGGVAPPGAFLPAAERFAMMPSVDRWVIDHAFQALEERYPAGTGSALVSASINLSGQTLGEPWLREHICGYFERGVIRPDQVCFEVTETTAISDFSRAVVFMGQLKDIGCHFALDDFGTGLSSFSYLRELPLDYLKIDGSLMRGIATDPVGYEMIAAINRIGHAMDMLTVAEWVETADSLAALQSIGVDFAQGYHVGKPVPLAEMARIKIPG